MLICEKVIVDNIGRPTLVSLFQRISALLPEGQEIPKAAIAMTSWVVFCEWLIADEEQEKTFVQVLEVMHPDGTPSPIRHSMPLKELVKHGQGTRAYVNITGMPVSQKGFLTVNVWLESDSQRVTDVCSSVVEIEHTSQPPTPNDGGSIIHALVPQQPAK